jgi:hypothetical protein
MVLCLGLEIGATEAGIFDGVGGATDVFGDHIRVIETKALAVEGAFALGGIGGDVLNRDRLRRDCSEQGDEEERC